ncbi:MAG: hypothetical protein H8E34_12650 [Bacteroidetes bacterium]|nr:hypothetical protein [Bacteroidota bacterium]MBL6943783.1 hypothetical protein [Bacteroidales bacterium]
MHKLTRSLILLLLSIGFVLVLGAFRFEGNKKSASCHVTQKICFANSVCHKNPDGSVIEWQSDFKLKQSDFKAARKENPGSAVATTVSAFGYHITDDDGKICGHIYVRFYCNESWWNSNIIRDDAITDVLEHEQLHFDICELFGRKLYKELLELRNSGRFNSHNIERLQSKLEKQYSNYQDKYDKDTEHSINRVEQYYWSKRVKKELEAMSAYSNYHNF